MRRRHLTILALLLAGCVHTGTPALTPGLSVEQIAPLFPSRVQDAEGWARELLVALETVERRYRACLARNRVP